MRIGTGISGVDLTARFNLAKAFDMMAESALKLSTLTRINRGSDDPAGLIATEELQAELTAIRAASDNAARASGIVHVADSALSEVNGLLNTVRGNIVAAAGGGYSDAEVAAMQLENDAALEAINRIGNSTSYGGRELLDGGGQFTFVFSPDVTDTATLDMPTVSTAALGDDDGRLAELFSGGNADLTSGNLGQAMDILDTAGSQITSARAELGAFEKYTIDSSQEVLAGMELNISSAQSQIFDTDVAAETSRWIKAQILAETSIATMDIAAQQRSMVWNLLQGMNGSR